MQPAPTLTEEILKRMPLKDCGGRFCLNSGPSTSLGILCEGPSPALLVGFCAVCRRFVCGQCAVRQATDEIAEGARWACRHCGLALGAKPGSLLVPGKFAERLGKAASQLVVPDRNELQDGEWTELYREAVRRGAIKTSGLLKVRAALETEQARSALALLAKEERLCRAAGYEAGLAHCASAKAVAWVSLGRHEPALGCMELAEPIWRRLGNRKMLARSLFGKYFLLFGKHFLDRPDQRTAEAKLEQLQEMWEVARGIDEEIVERAIDERTKIHLARGDLVSFVGDLRFASGGTRKIEDAAALWMSSRPSAPRKAGHDEALIRRMRSAHDVWGCPNGCKPAGTMGVVGLPKGHSLRMDCLVCGARYVCLNNYSRVTASVPDWPELSKLKRRDFPEAARQGLAIVNFALSLRDDGRAATADELQEMAVSAWTQHLGDETVAFARCLEGLARALSGRDEHALSRGFLERAAAILEVVDPPEPRQLSSVLSNLGLALTCLGEYGEAERVLNRALAVFPALAGACYWQAKLYRFRALKGDERREAQAWRDYLANEAVAGPRRVEAKARLATLESGEDSADGGGSAAESQGDSLERLRRRAESYRTTGDDESLLACLAEQFDEALSIDSSVVEDIAIEMEDAARRLGTAPALVSALSRRVATFLERGDGEELRLMAELEALARELGDRSALAQSLHAQGVLHEKQGRLDQALQACDAAAALYTELREVVEAFICSRRSVGILANRQQWDLAAPRARAVTRLARFLEEPAELLGALRQEAIIQQELGEPWLELDLHREIAAICRRDEDAPGLMAALCRQADLFLQIEVDSRPSSSALTEAYELSKLEIAKLVAKAVSPDAPEFAEAMEQRRTVLGGFDRVSRAEIDSGQLTLGIATCEHAIRLREAALDQPPGDPGLREGLAVGLDQLGNAFLRAGREHRARAIRCFRRAMDQLELLGRSRPGIRDDAAWRALRDSVASHLAQARRRSGWWGAARTALRWLGRRRSHRGAGQVPGASPGELDGAA